MTNLVATASTGDQPTSQVSGRGTSDRDCAGDRDRRQQQERHSDAHAVRRLVQRLAGPVHARRRTHRGRCDGDRPRWATQARPPRTPPERVRAPRASSRSGAAANPRHPKRPRGPRGACRAEGRPDGPGRRSRRCPGIRGGVGRPERHRCDPGSSGYVTVYPAGGARPVVSNLNFDDRADRPQPGRRAAELGRQGVAVQRAGGHDRAAGRRRGLLQRGATDAAGAFGSLAPSRILDTRSGNGAPAAPSPQGDAVAVGQRTGRSALRRRLGGRAQRDRSWRRPPAVTSRCTRAAAPVPSCRTSTSPRGRLSPNLVIVPVGARRARKSQLFNGSGGTTHLLADVAGYFVAGSPTLSGAFATVAPDAGARHPQPQRGHHHQPGGARATVPLQVTGRGGVPSAGVGRGAQRDGGEPDARLRDRLAHRPGATRLRRTSTSCPG